MDPYVYPGTNVLKNLRDIRDPERLAKFGMDMTTRRLAELSVVPTPGRFDIPHLQAIHRHVFQDVFPWAGHFRTVNISRSGQFPFAFHEQIAPCLDSLFETLRKERYLEGLAHPDLAQRTAWYLGELNAVHPFREGNGRTQREYVRQLAHRTGFAADWTCIAREEMIDASRQSS